MRKQFFFLLALVFCAPVWAAHMPDNMYFRAMKDEMDRSLKELRVKGSPDPYYVAFKLSRTLETQAHASFGEAYPRGPQTDTLGALVMLAAGTPRSDSLGFDSDRFYYRPGYDFNIAQSYAGIRQALWMLADQGYMEASDAYEKKQAYKRQKNLTDKLPDFIRAPQASFVEDIPAFAPPPVEELENLARTLSAKGGSIAYLEDFSVKIHSGREEIYYLNSDGGFYQLARPYGGVALSARFRNRDGYKEELFRKIRLADSSLPDKKELEKQTDEFLAELDKVYNAKKAEPYLGPVLLKPQAASGFLSTLFIRNMRNIKPLLSAQRENDPTAGLFRDKTGMRVMSNVIDVYDKPLLRSYKGKPLDGFMPVDDEGVAPKELTLVSAGRLRELPLSRRPAKEGNQSNGHARMGWGTNPREALTNVFVEAKQPLSDAEMEAKLLSRCRELELEYCYVLTRFPEGGNSLQTEAVNAAERIYTKDGRKEPVFGVKIAGLTTRSLRDILAAGTDEEVAYASDSYNRPFSVVTPSLLVDEIEILPDEKKADRRPFIAKP